MADNRATIYIGPPLQAALAGHENRSGRINTIADRYLAILRYDMPELAEADWNAICDVCNGWLATPADDARHLWMEVEDAAEGGLGEKWGIDARALAIVLKGMSVGQRMAVLEVAERFWASEGKASLTRCGARVKT